MHLFVWGSILIWFVIIPITHTGTFYGSFFEYSGVSFEVLSTVNFWFYLPLSAALALLPTILFRMYNLYWHPTYVDFVRLKEKKEGKKLFKRKLIGRKTSSARSMKRSGYAFAHEEGFAELITTGHIFGMNEENVAAEHLKRRSVILSGAPSRAGTEPPLVSRDVSEIALPTVSISAALMHLGTPVVVDVVEEDRNSSSNTEVTNSSGDKPAFDGDREGDAASSEDDHKTQASILQSEASTQIEPIELDLQKEETDSALPPSVRIPGLVDSPEDSKEEKSASEASKGQTEGDEFEEKGSEAEEDVLIPM